jgi:hypothetical protein
MHWQIKFTNTHDKTPNTFWLPKRLRSSRQKQMQMMKKKKMNLQVNSLPYVAV